MLNENLACGLWLGKKPTTLGYDTNPQISASQVSLKFIPVASIITQLAFIKLQTDTGNAL